MAKKKAAAKRKTWDSYEDYLKSKEWKEIRHKVKDRDVICQVCDEDKGNLHCHHFNYPKDWNNDSPDNVVLLCDECHKESHSYFAEWNFENKWHFLCEFKKIELNLANEFHDDAIMFCAHLVVNNDIKVGIEIFPNNEVIIGGIKRVPPVHGILEKISTIRERYNK